MKTCSKCQEELDESSFSKNKASKDGLFCWCRDCHSEYKKKQYAAQRRADGVVVKPRAVAIKDALRQKRIVEYGIDLVEVLDTLE
jgi:NAD-dependent SIR2 family protein deacetylase